MKKKVQQIVMMFFISVVILVGLLIYGIVLIFSWPWWAWWVGLFLALLLMGLGVGGFLIWNRRKEQNFFNEMSEQYIATAKALSTKEKSDFKDGDRFR